MLILILKISGIYFGYCSLQFYFSRKHVARSVMTKIVSAYFVFQVIQTFFLHNLFMKMCFIFVPIPIFIATYLLIIKYLESRFRYEFPAILTNVILQMKMGQSFRASLFQVTEYSRPRYRIILESIAVHVAFSQQKTERKLGGRSQFLNEIVRTFVQVDQSSHRAIEKLENFRTRLIILNEFRRRSGQIRAQVHLQAYVLTAIYLGSFVFVGRSFPLNEVYPLILMSFLLFVAGLIVLLMMGRRIKWNI